MNINEENYNNLFKSESSKAKAFDLIAKNYYLGNFGTMSKSDIEVLLFSIYIEQILDNDAEDFNAYSDYNLSKQLGITQSRISNLKERKELKYPYSKFNWRKSLLKIANNAVYENGYIKLNIPDKNLYNEVKNAIEEANGFLEVQLTPKLLKVRLSYFIDLMVAISEEADREEITKKLRGEFKINQKVIETIEGETFGEALERATIEDIASFIGNCIPIFKGTVKQLVEMLASKATDKIKKELMLAK